MINQLLEIRIKYEKKQMLIYSALIFLEEAFSEAKNNNHQELVLALKEFRDCMPDSLKTLHTDEVPDHVRYFFNLFLIELVSDMELFLIEIITLIISKHPQKIGKQKVLLSDVVNLGNKRKIIKKACYDYLNSLSYKKPQEYQKEFFSLLSANDDFLKDEWKYFIEMKARRDIGVHNDWKINDIYKGKVLEIGIKPDETISYLYPDDKYIIKCINIHKNIINTVCDHVEEKFT